jgi:hypothetical protein
MSVIESIVEVVSIDAIGATVVESVVEETTKGFFSSLVSGVVEGVCENPLVVVGVVAVTAAAAGGYWFWKNKVATDLSSTKEEVILEVPAA